ncbi:MAG: GGDEF domain-containing protein [Xanthobacteraceae bacterium]
MQLFAALIYWAIVALWLTVLGTVIFFYIRNPKAFGTTRLLLAVLAIDTTRNILENSYFGVYFGAQYGLFPSSMTALLGQPVLLVLPKLVNVIAGCFVLGLLLLRWLPLAIKERGRADQHAADLETLAAVDWLTGLYNRRHFETLAQAELARSQRYMRPLTVMMMDIDHFKDVNDTYGHATGDRVLQALATVCLATKRDADVIGRIGGEEFALLLPETTDTAAAQFAERLRQQIRDCAPVVGGEKLPITVSIGIAGVTLTTSGIQPLLNSADQALYDAKHSGRNRVVLSRPPVEMALQDAAE